MIAYSQIEQSLSTEQAGAEANVDSDNFTNSTNSVKEDVSTRAFSWLFEWLSGDIEKSFLGF